MTPYQNELGEEGREQAATRGREADQNEPRIARAYYEEQSGRLLLELSGGALGRPQLSFVARSFPGLEEATNAQLSAFIVAGQGSSIRWPDLQVGIGTPGLVRWVTGLHEPTLTRHLSNIGKMRSEAKAASSRINGAKGGRPRKKAAS